MASPLSHETEDSGLQFQEDDIAVKEEPYDDDDDDDYEDINPLDFVEVQDEEEGNEEVAFAKYEDEVATIGVEESAEDAVEGAVEHDENREFQNPYWIQGLSDVGESVEAEIDQKPFNCSDCTASFTTLSHLEMHKILFHSDCKPFPCYKCTKTFARRRTLRSHFVSIHHILGRFECFECSFDFDNEEALKKHVEVDHSPITPYQCVECDNAYYRKDRLKAHFESAHSLLKMVKCETCCARFPDKVKLRLHIATSHLNIKSFECPKCDAKFAKFPALKGHLQTVHCVERPFKCPLCQYFFSSEALLRRHIESVHLDLKPFHCLYCNNRYASQRSVHKHVRTIHHKQSMPRKCPKCSLLFEDKRAANEHYTNSDCGKDRQRPFLCDECNASFTQRAHLCVHRKSVHREPKGLKCPLCGVGFSYKTTLKRHLTRFHSSALNALEKVEEFERNDSVGTTEYNKSAKSLESKGLCHSSRETGRLDPNAATTNNLENSKCKSSKSNQENVKRFHCDYCPTAFTQINHMYAHRKRFHRLPTAQQCLPCDSSFSQSYSLSIPLVTTQESDPSTMLGIQSNRDSRGVRKRKRDN